MTNIFKQYSMIFIHLCEMLNFQISFFFPNSFIQLLIVPRFEENVGFRNKVLCLLSFDGSGKSFDCKKKSRT